MLKNQQKNKRRMIKIRKSKIKVRETEQGMQRIIKIIKIIKKKNTLKIIRIIKKIETVDIEIEVEIIMMTIKTEITDLEVNTDQEEKTTKMIIEKIMGLQTILIPIKIMEIDIELKAEVLIETTEITETGMVREIIEVDP